MTNKHTCQAVIISCVDFRFVDAINDFAKKKLGLENDFDHIKIAGASLPLANPSHPAIRGFILSQLEICVKKHQAKEVYLINHEDCGAYGGQVAFDSREAEFRQHRHDLEKAKKIIQEAFPEVKVKVYRLNLQPTM